MEGQMVTETANKGLVELLNTAIAAFNEADYLVARRNQVTDLLDDMAESRLRVGLVGITSSGKSTFINAMMGEEILPEESRATTNLLIRCRKGEHREVVIHAQNQEPLILSGTDLTSDRMKSFASERLNPRNQKKIELLEWRSPEGVFPDRLVLFDTPGLDAYGLPEHRDLVLRQFLPMADIIIYMTSIRNPLKKADLELVEKLIENDQRVLFLLTQADLESDDMEGGKVLRSREDKLREQVQRIESHIKEAPNLKSYGVVLISSRWAKDGGHDRGTPEWQASNFESVLSYLERFTRDLDHHILDARGRKLSRILAQSTEELEQILSRKDAEAPSAPPPDAIERVELLESDLLNIAERIDTLGEKWMQHFDVDFQTQKLRDRFAEQDNVEGLRGLYDKYCHHWDAMTGALIEQLDENRIEFRKVLEAHHVEPARKNLEREISRSDVPDFDNFLNIHSEKVRTRDWGIRWIFWPKIESVTYQEVDKDELTDVMEDYLAALLPPLADHLNWWIDFVSQVYVEPLRQEFEAEKRALEEARQSVAESKEERQRLELLRARLGDTQAEISKLLKNIHALLDWKSERAGLIPTPPSAAKIKSRIAQAAMPLHSLIARFQELSFQRFFLDAFDRQEQIKTGKRRHILLLGPNRDENIRLLSLLGHELAMCDRLQDAPADMWVACGPTEGLDLGFNTRAITPPATILQDMTILIAPDDERLEPLDWHKLLAQFDTVGVALNMKRIASGISDLDRAPYTGDLLRQAGKAVITCANGGLFADKLEDILVDVVESLNAYCETIDVPTIDRYFIHENYDVRYTHFQRLGSDILERNAAPQEIRKSWRNLGLSLSDPFTDDALEDAIVVALKNIYRRLLNDQQ